MSKWEDVVTGNHIDLISGYAFKSSDFIENKVDGVLPVIKIKNVANGDVNFNDVVYHKYDSNLERFVLSKGDVLIAMTGNHPHAETQIVGDVSKYKLDEKALLNQRVGKIIPKGKTDLNFIYYLFKNEDVRYNLANKSSGSANQANISKADILSLEVTIPSPAEQAAIGSVLCSLDNKIDLLNCQNTTLEKMAETLFRKWFIEDVKEEWPVIRLEKLVKLKQGKYIKAEEISESPLNEFIYPLYGGNGTRGFLASYDYDTPKVAITCRGNGCGLIQLLDPFSTVSNSCIVFENDASISTCFLYYCSKFLDFGSVTSGSAQPQITITDVGKLEITVPDKEALQKFDRQVEVFQEKILFNKTQISNLTILRDNLLPKLMSGEVTID